MDVSSCQTKQWVMLVLVAILAPCCEGWIALSTRKSDVLLGHYRAESRPQQAGAGCRKPSVLFSVNKETRQEQEQSLYMATCIPGLSKILSYELQELGSWDVETSGNSAVWFKADLRTALRILIWARTPHKIMELLCESPPSLINRNDLYEFVRNSLPIKQILGNGQGGLLTLSVSTILNNARHLPEDINHSHFTALTIKNSICDAVRDLRGDRPNVDIVDPDLPLVAVVRGNPGAAAQLSLFRQIHSPASLHRRGYRSDNAIHKAAIKESLAAGLLISTGWPKLQRNEQPNPETLVMVDPMAGSGTLLLEAIFLAADVAPHVLRIKCGLQPTQAHQFPPIVRWKHSNLNVDVAILWKQLLLEASDKAKMGLHNLRTSKNISFVANDVHPGALKLLQQALASANVADLVTIHQDKCQDLLLQQHAQSSWIIVCNPPWGIRLPSSSSSAASHEDSDDNAFEAWEELGFFLHNSCPQGTVAHILSGNPQATQSLGLRRSASLPLQVGDVPVRWLTYHIGLTPTKRNSEFPLPVEDESKKTQNRDQVKSQEEGRKNKKKQTSHQKQKKSFENEWMVG